MTFLRSKLKIQVQYLMILDREVSNKLEIRKVLEKFIEEARSQPGVDFLNDLGTSDDIFLLKKRQKRIREFMHFRDVYNDMPWKYDLRSIIPLIQSAHKDAFLSGQELVHFKDLFSIAQKIRNRFFKLSENYPAIWEISRKIKDFSNEVESLSSLNDDGTLLDSASAELSFIRRRLFSTKKRLRETANGILGEPRLSAFLRDRSLMIRNGRYVLAVRQEMSGRFPGIIQDRSGSGNTVFMEPNSMIESNNNLALLFSEEREEEAKILREMTGTVLSRKTAIIEAEKAVGHLDMLYAITSVISEKKWNLPDLSTKSIFHLKRVIHPLLNVEPVPLDISCGDRFRILVITGPNTGGKTVALKTAALSVILGWLGLPVPAAEGTIIGNFSHVSIDVGDEQSVEQNLSTFSSHIANLVRMLNYADKSSLLFLDELGSGTDPQEGAALGIAILDALKEIDCCALATTHHNTIKSYAITESRIETASMEFNEETLAPTYRMMIGVPGKSNALHIAAKLGIPPKIIERARAALSSREVSYEEIVNELQSKKARIDKATLEIEQEKRHNKQIYQQLEQERRSMENEKRAILQESKEKAARVVSDAEEEARHLLRQLKGIERSEGHRIIAHQKKKKKPVREIEKNGSIKESDSEKTKPRLETGSYVKVSGSDVKGQVLKIKGKKAIVQSGQIKVEVPVSKLALSSAQISSETKGSKSGVNVSRPPRVQNSIMIRGMTISEAVPLVERYLDQAFRAGYSSVCIIHGRGEGILRREVHKICSDLSYVDSYRLGDGTEGGYGVTIVKFIS